MRALGVDFGFRTIGLAVGELGYRVFVPRPPLAASGALAKDAKALAEIVKREEAELVVLGLPIEESGVEGRMAKICRRLGTHLSQLGLSVEYVDESHTSLEAAARLSERMESAERTRKRAEAGPLDIHGEAAVLILERYSL